MATRQFDQQDLSVIKQPVSLWAHVQVGAAGSLAAPNGLQKWLYGAFQAGTQGTTINTYAAAATATAPLGFPQNYSAGSDGVFSVTRTNTGLWTVTLQDTYIRLLSMAVHISIAGGLSNIVAVGENTTITNMRAANGSVIGVALLSSTGTAADPTSGSLVHLNFRLQNASEP